MPAFHVFRRTCRTTVVLVLIALSASLGAHASDESFEADRIQPYAENPFYWQYRGEPILLIGGTHDDNPFNNPSHDPVDGDERLADHLDLLASAGGNYVRNTMSHRDIFNVYPYLREPDRFRDAMEDASLWTSLDAGHGVQYERSLDGAGAVTVWTDGDSDGALRIRRELEPTDVADGTLEAWFHVRDGVVAERLEGLDVTLEGAGGSATLRWPGDVLAGWHVVILPVTDFAADGLDVGSVRAVELTVRVEEGASLRQGDVLWDEVAILGRFDLDRFNPEYFDRLRTFLDMSLERDLIVQLELWDKVELFDDGGSSAQKWDPRRGWSKHPFNPRNNVNYTAESSGLPEVVDWSYNPGQSRPFGDKDAETLHPFFYTVPSVAELLPGGPREIEGIGLTEGVHRKLVETVLPYQEAFVAEVLGVALAYPNVIYAVNNETYLPAPDWSDHWAERIHDAAAQRGVSAEVGDMRGDGALESAPDHSYRYLLAHPERYTFIDVSQNTTAKSGDAQWSELQWIRSAMAAMEDGTRPITNVKVYDFTGSSLDMDPLDASVQKFWRNILGGASSSRFHRRMGAALHRPVDGDGTPIEDESNEAGLATFRSVTRFVEAFDVFHARPDNGVLLDRASHASYAMVGPRDSYAVYVPEGGEVRLEVRPGRYRVRWLDLREGAWLDAAEMRVDNELETTAPISTHALVVVTRSDP